MSRFPGSLRRGGPRLTAGVATLLAVGAVLTPSIWR
jgi:hypothetical protein